MFFKYTLRTVICQTQSWTWVWQQMWWSIHVSTCSQQALSRVQEVKSRSFLWSENHSVEKRVLLLIRVSFKEGKLYYVGPKKEEKREVVIEAGRKRQIFLDCHFNDIGHHLGQKKTVHRIQSKYYWLGIIRDVVDWVNVFTSLEFSNICDELIWSDLDCSLWCFRLKCVRPVSTLRGLKIWQGSPGL